MLGQFLKSLRRGKGLKCAETTKNMGISDKQLHYIERNTGAYSVLKLANHVQALNYRVELHFIDLDDKRNVMVYEVKPSIENGV